MAGRDPDTLTPRERLFIDEYSIDHNATRAYKAAGYQCKQEASYGPNAGVLLKKHKIQREIRRRDAARSMDAGARQDKVIKELLCIAHLDPADVLNFDGVSITLRPARDIPEHARRAIASVKVKQVLDKTPQGMKPAELVELKFWDKNSALDKLMRHLGLYAADNKQGSDTQQTGLAYEIDKLQLDLETRVKLLAAMKRVYGEGQPTLPDTNLNGEVDDGTEAESADANRPGTAGRESEPIDQRPVPSGPVAAEPRVQDPQSGEWPGGDLEP